MKEVEALRGIDVYLIDQLLKGRISNESRILDAGCGGGRNSHYLIQHGFDLIGIDENDEAIAFLQETYPELADQFIISSVENYTSLLPFDFIICNAVLHFARDHDHFENMFAALVKNLAEKGVLFIRMTSDIGLKLDVESKNGVYNLPDGSVRYLISRPQVTELLQKYDLELVEPVKTVKVEELRSMTTLVFTRKSS